MLIPSYKFHYYPWVRTLHVSLAWILNIISSFLKLIRDNIFLELQNGTGVASRTVKINKLVITRGNDDYLFDK
jgi:hypothetical protein